MTAGAVILLVSVVTGERVQLRPAQVSAASALGFSHLVVFGSLLAFTAYTWLLQNAPIQRVATYAYVNPAVAFIVRKEAAPVPEEEPSPIEKEAVWPSG